MIQNFIFSPDMVSQIKINIKNYFSWDLSKNK